MPDFKTIWLTTDFSENANAAIPYAGELARRFGGKVTLVHVFDGTYLSEAGEEGALALAAHWIDPIYERLGDALKERAAKIAQQEKIAATPLMLRGNTVAEIVKGLKTKAADCLVISTHGRTGLSHMLWGSVAERLVRLSPCPVFSVNPMHVVKQ